MKVSNLIAVLALIACATGCSLRNPKGCPEISNEAVFLPGISCGDYFICISGEPIKLSCRPGQHWNHEKKFCDDPAFAGCRN